MEKTKKTKVGVLFTGGKDSCLALHRYGKKNIDVLLSMIPENKDSFMFHSPDLRLLKKQAEMLELPLIMQKTRGEEEKELEDLKKMIKKSKVKKLIIGGIQSIYQVKRIKRICSELRIRVEAPLWDYDTGKLWKELLEEGFKVIIVKIASEGIPKEFIGKILEVGDIVELVKLSRKYGFRMDFEGGDAETSVLYMPGFKREIKIEYDIESEDVCRHFLKIKEIKI